MVNEFDVLGRFKKPRKAGQTPFTDTTDRCSRVGYTPTHQRMADLISAGLNTQMVRDSLYDQVSDADKDLLHSLPKIPPIRRHLDTDLADLTAASQSYQFVRREIERRKRERIEDAARKKELEKTSVVSTPPNDETKTTSPTEKPV